MKQKLLKMAGLAAVALLAVGAVATRTKYLGVFVGDGSGLTNVPVSGLAGSLSFITNAVVSGVVTNGNGSITVTLSELVYVGLRP
jgi:hypothetical protein